MASQKWEESLRSLGAKLDELSDKANEAAAAAKSAQQAKKEELETKISDAKGDFTAMQEQVREASERGKSKMFAELLKAQMTVEAKLQDARDTRDKKRLERYIENQITRTADCYEAALFLIMEAKLASLEALSAAAEYEDRFGTDDE